MGARAARAGAALFSVALFDGGTEALTCVGACVRKDSALLPAADRVCLLVLIKAVDNDLGFLGTHPLLLPR